MKANLLLCDHAAVAEGKLYISGAGWSVMGAGAPSAIAVLIAVPWDLANHKIQMDLRLHDADGNPVTQPGPEGEPTPIEVNGQMEVGRPPGATPGTSLDLPLAINLGPLPLTPGARYTWVLSIDGETHEDWHLPFGVRPT